MKTIPFLVAIGIVLSAGCYAQHCPDPRLHQAVIGGDTIVGAVLLHHKPLLFAESQLFFSDGKAAWVGTTDKNGGFHIRHLRPDTYRLVVQGWGSTTIRISANLTKLHNGQTPFYSVQLMDDGCIGTSIDIN
jgi:hypothetical protein